MWRALVALHVGSRVVWATDCSHDHEDCSHTGRCCDASKQCFEKDPWWSGCLSQCTEGWVNPDAPSIWQKPWSCISVSSSEPACAAQGENCAHLGCCRDAGFTCYEKNFHWAQCLQSCEPQPHDPHWSCTQIGVEPPAPEPPVVAPAPPPAPGGPAYLPYKGLSGTHFWDCNGGSCDAPVLQPWETKQYKYSPHYAPVDPMKHGGPAYGEKIWMTGAASFSISQELGPDTDCCGFDDKGGGGCGQCLLVRTDNAVNSDWTAIIMKKNLCPDHGGVCSGKHFDFAVPGFDHLGVSTSNVCGSPDRSDTYITQQESALCGRNHAPSSCDCSSLPGRTPEQLRMREGCQLFKQWGWTTGHNQFHYKKVTCPQNFVDLIGVGKGFGRAGVVSMYDNSTTLAVLGDSAAPGRSEIGQKQWMLLCSASPFVLIGAVLFVGLRARASFQKQPVDREELMELQPTQ